MLAVMPVKSGLRLYGGLRSFTDYSWAFILILGISCATITVLIKRLIEVVKIYKKITRIVFGDDYYKKEKELIARFWTLKNKGMKDDDIFKSLESYPQRD